MGVSRLYRVQADPVERDGNKLLANPGRWRDADRRGQARAGAAGRGQARACARAARRREAS